MQSIAYLPGSNGAANASLMTVQTLRSPGATTIVVNTVANVPAKFYATMGEPHTFVDPVTAETVTLISEATAVDFAGSVTGSTINIDAIAPGYLDTRGSKAGDIIVIRPVTEWANNLTNVLNAAHNDNGSLKSAAVLSSISDGTLSTVKLQNPYKFRANKTGASQSISAGSTAVIIFNSESYDTSNNYNVSNGRFTAPIAGFYEFKWVVTIGAGTGDVYGSFLRKNGVNDTAGTAAISAGTFTHSYPGSTEIQLAVNDYVDITFLNGSGGAKGTNTGLWENVFSGHLISQA